MAPVHHHDFAFSASSRDDRDLIRPEHDVGVDVGSTESDLLELAGTHRIAALEISQVAEAERYVRSGVLVEEREIEEQLGVGESRVLGDQGEFAEIAGAFMGLEPGSERLRALLALKSTTRPPSKVRTRPSTRAPRRRRNGRVAARRPSVRRLSGVV